MVHNLESYLEMVNDITGNDTFADTFVKTAYKHNRKNIEGLIVGYLNSIHGHMASHDFENKLKELKK